LTLAGEYTVAQRHYRCDTNRLRLLLEDALPTPRQAEVVHHLDDCRECQQTLEKLAADRRLWDELPGLNDRHEREGGVPMSNGCPSATSVDSTQASADAESGPFALDFLDPADDPTHLGRLDRFAVTDVLGRGGMGVVLRVFDPALNRPVAIKVLAPYFASSGAARKRFDREAKAAATVVHPHVVAIHTVDAWKGLPYLVMSYIAGRSLQERLDSDGPMEIKDILRIGMQTASGLAAAHAQGLVHRDVKPANILLENGVGRVWLTDFGLARAVDDASLTQSGVIAGTPQYMAPEQAQGHGVDHRADLFSLGSTLYAMCTAVPPMRRFEPSPPWPCFGVSATINPVPCARSIPMCLCGWPASSTNCTPRTPPSAFRQRPRLPTSLRNAWRTSSSRTRSLFRTSWPLLFLPASASDVVCDWRRQCSRCLL